MCNDAVARRKWSFHDSTISDNVKRREVRRCHTLREGCYAVASQTPGETVCKMELRPLYPGGSGRQVRLPLRGISIIAITKVGSTKGERQVRGDVGITQLCIVPSVAKKPASSSLAARSILSLL
jgi:hypothetical protein